MSDTGNIYWNGVSSETFHVFCEKYPNYEKPERKVKRYSVPGRSGDIVFVQDAWENTPQSYDIIGGTGAEDSTVPSFDALAAWLCAPMGYCRLADDFDPLHYRRAMLSDSISIANLVGRSGRAKITFTCDPRRFLLSGETPINMSASGSVLNPTVFTAKPIITVTGTAGGSGTISIGGKTLTISYIVNGMVLDSDEENARSADHASNYNNYVSGEFPVIPGGSQTVTITGAISGLSIVPNWWEI